MKSLVAYTILSIAILSCSDNKDYAAGKGSITIVIDTRAGEDDFNFHTTYQNELGQDFQVSTLKYTVTGFRLRRVDGTYFESQSHKTFAVDESVPGSSTITLKEIPPGDYDAIEFMIAGDDAYFQISGTSQESAEPGHVFRYTLSGPPNYRIKFADFHGEWMTVEWYGQPELHFVLDVLHVFKGTIYVDFSAMPVCEEILCAANIADNYLWTFSYDFMLP